MASKRVFLYIASIAIVVVLILYVGVNNFVSAFSEANYLLLLLAFIPQFMIICVQVFRMTMLLGREISFRGLFPIYIISLTVNKVSPVGVAGEPVKAFFLKRFKSISYARSIMSIILERTFDMSMVGILLIFSIITLNFLPSEMILLTAYSLLLSFIFIFLIFLIYLRRETFIGLCRFGIRMTKRVLRSRRIRGIDENALDSSSIPNSSISKVLLLTITRWLLGALRTGMVIMAFGQIVPVPVVFLIVTMSTIVTIMPILPGGAGLVESITTAIYSMFGIGFSMALSISLFDRFISFYIYPLLSVLAGIKTSTSAGRSSG